MLEWPISFWTAVVVSMWFAIYESLHEHRCESVESWYELVRMILSSIGDFILIPYHWAFGCEKPTLGYLKSKLNNEIVESCPSLHRFHPTCWLHNPFLSFGVMLGREFLWEDNVYRREKIVAADGGIIALDWQIDNEDELALDSPIMFCISTLAGDPLCYPNAKTMDHFANNGYRSVCYVKRGTGVRRINPYVTAKTWCLNDYDDVLLAVEHIKNKYPNAKICGVGLSTGGGQLRNYLARSAKSTKLDAAVVVDAGFHWSECVSSLDKRLPLLSYALAQAVLAPYLMFAKTEVGGKSVPLKTLRNVNSFGNLIDKVMAPSNGFRGKTEEYMHYSLPADPKNITVPCLNIFTMNDQIISRDNILENKEYFKCNENILFATTHRGTHVIRWEGLFGQHCWLSQVSLEFFNAVMSKSNITT